MEGGITSWRTNNGINVFAGGNFTTTAGATEAEGVLAVAGSASFAQSSNYNVGVVGGGSGWAPNEGSDMLLIGGDASAGSGVVHVGLSAAVKQGGHVKMGGNNNAAGKIQTGGGTVAEGGIETNLGAAGAYDFGSFEQKFKSLSAGFAAQPANGTHALVGDMLTFTGNGSDELQVFEISGDELGNSAKKISIKFDRIPADAKIVVNVSGGSAETYFNSVFAPNSAALLAEGADGFGQLAASLVWNFKDATSVLIDGAQIPGSILVPAEGSQTTVAANGTNGRVYVAGDLKHQGNGGNEFHAYPLIGIDCETPGEPVIEEQPEKPKVTEKPKEPVEPEGPLDPVDPEKPVVQEDPEKPVVQEDPEEPVVDPAPADPESQEVTDPKVQADDVTPLAQESSQAPAPQESKKSTPAATTPAGQVAAKASPSATGAAVAADGLARTGANSNTLILGLSAVLLLALGGIAVATVRRRH